MSIFEVKGGLTQDNEISTKIKEFNEFDNFLIQRKNSSVCQKCRNQNSFTTITLCRTYCNGYKEE
jgi:hypothetical protein